MKSVIANNQRLIVALDFADIESAKKLVNELGDEATFYKVGLELFMSGDYFKLIEFLAEKKKRIFADLKLLDISATVGKAVKNLSKSPNIDFLTIHAASKDIMRAAVENKGKMKILAVTVLTNLNQNDLVDMGFEKDVEVKDLVLKKSQLAQSCGVDGVIASGLEADKIRSACKDDFLIVTPGVRLETLKNDDQKRTVDIKTAFKNGANYIVVGRPIHSSTNPVLAAKKIQQEINNIFP